MTRLFFISHRTDWGRLHWAKDGDLYFLVYDYDRDPGLLGRVSDVSKSKPIIHEVDWRHHRVHPDEMKKNLQGWANQLPLDFQGGTSTLEDVDKKETQ